MDRLGKNFVLLFLGFCLTVPSLGIAMPKKPKPTPTPTPDPDPEIVYVQEKKKGRVWTTQIKVMNADGSNQTEVVDCGTSSCGEPDWSPNGSQIIFVSDAFDLSDPPFSQAIYVIDVDGENLDKIVDLNGGRGQPAWSLVTIGEQHWIVYSDETLSNPCGGYHDLYAYGMSDATIVQLTFFEDITVDEPAWSADGTYLAARLMWDLHPWHVSEALFEVGEDQIEDPPGNVITVPVLERQSWIDSEAWGLPCSFWSPDWSVGPGPFWMLGMCGLEITYLVDFGDYPNDITGEEEFGLVELVRAPLNLREQIPPTGGPEGVYGIWVQKGRFSPDNTQFVFQAVFRDPHLKATGIYVASTDNSGPVVELIKIGITQGAVGSPEWRPPVP